MSAAQFERLQEHMQRLRLFKSRERLEAVLQDAPAKEASYADFLDALLTEEVASKTAKQCAPTWPAFPSSRASTRSTSATSLHRQEADPDARQLSLHRARREHRPARPARVSDIMPTSLYG
jgi:DNA replication protein DnaC